jgi:hypothetical protein
VLLEYLQKIIDYFNGKGEPDRKMVEQYTEILENCFKNNIISRVNLDLLVTKKIKESKIRSSEPITKFLESYSNSNIDNEVSETMKEAMKKGVKVRMYKVDGSNSALVLYFTPDLLELNCVVALGEPVKNKWKLPINEIVSIQPFADETSYKDSVFYLSSGIFSKAPPFEQCLSVLGKEKKNFHICFESTTQLK